MDIQPTYSSLDFPGKMALVIFNPGCDLACKYCHNPQLLKHETITDDQINNIKKAIYDDIDFIDGIVISGGEPLLSLNAVKKYIGLAKKEDLLVKLDTNGAHPENLKKIIGDIDYIALDIKAPLDEYYRITSQYPNNIAEKILDTMSIIKRANVFLECRTTYVPELLYPEDIQKIVSMISCDQYTLQQFRNRVTLDSSLSFTKEPLPKDLQKILFELDTDIPNIHLKTRQYGNQILKGR
ncbi:MAG: anaerobic ribonucleoside-triphosphate reductase activating protein [Methanobacteriaceae archaeon]|nr:anaerobic ribonucleoside-triphosphate reductase activating protein [Methanobacteriaceae archaeon]